ncbi:ParA family protein [Commensalibacter communis]|uniref:ParA family protein n=1 Tax=Commensalibacter communis TaxID=2972786 RepID=UPI0022FF7B14|nr:ParA family protein [Commensalibacter communis]CAI3960542.1 ParA-like ATPase involved in chromosome/plasmid partitioning or cellulose biosynthesis protein BcsQ (ParA) (PDB:6NOO) [Commensalibacter communis]CAI3961101.1 ParA-like ATPase involved in chromosome/plasmid partitioning or cellulose biosynthesis protein BcsQ (ParA) (PDB:6NOO) [Commensalibacter communis]
MKTIVIASQKGGSSKTTLVAHLAVAAEQSNISPTVLIDMDPQSSLSLWWYVRENSMPALAVSNLKDLPEKIKALKEAGVKLLIIDTPPAITDAIYEVVKLADLVIVPTRPSPHDLRAIGSTIDIIQKVKCPFIFIITQAKPNTRLTIQTIATLSEYGTVSPIIIHDRVDYASSMIDGKTVMETDKKGKSSQEIEKLLSFVLTRFQTKTKNKKKEIL